MPNKIQVNKTTSRKMLDAKLIKLPKKRMPIKLDKYFGKIDFGIDGLKYQLKVRNEWK